MHQWNDKEVKDLNETFNNEIKKSQMNTYAHTIKHENDHTEQLVRMEQKDLKKLIKLFMSKNKNLNVDIDDVIQPFLQDNYMDASYVIGDTKIIIENKCNDAGDMPNQIERYVQTAIRDGFDKENIFIFYLTKDGSKVPEETSLTQEAKDLLDFDTSGSRYSEINYRDHIIPFFRRIGKPEYADFCELALGLKCIDSIDSLPIEDAIELLYFLAEKGWCKTKNNCSEYRELSKYLIDEKIFKDLINYGNSRFGKVDKNNEFNYKTYMKFYKPDWNDHWKFTNVCYLIDTQEILTEKKMTVKFKVERPNEIKKYISKTSLNCDEILSQEMDLIEATRSKDISTLFVKEFPLDECFMKMDKKTRVKTLDNIFDSLEGITQRIDSKLQELYSSIQED